MLEGYFASVSNKRMIFKRKGVVMLWIYVVFECVLMVNGYPQQSNKGIKHHQNLILRSLSICDLNPLLHARVFYHGAVDQLIHHDEQEWNRLKQKSVHHCSVDMWFEIHLLLVVILFLTWLTWYVFFENEWAVIVTSGNSLLLAIWTKFLCLNRASRFLWNRNTDGCVCTSTKPLCIRILRAVTVLAFRLSQTWALFPSWCLRLMANHGKSLSHKLTPQLFKAYACPTCLVFASMRIQSMPSIL